MAASDKRTDRRDFYSVTIDYAYLKSVYGRTEYDTCSAVTTNLSRNGAGLFTSVPLQAGTEIEITSAEIMHCPCTAQVMWTSRLTSNLYRVGVQFN